MALKSILSACARWQALVQSRIAQNLPSGVSASCAMCTKADNRPSLETLCDRKFAFPPKSDIRVQSWVSTLSTLRDDRLGLIDLHPDVFAVHPRIDVIHANINWQLKYKRINYDRVKTRAEMPGGGRKPWPQKGQGRARHGSIRSPIWNKGGRAKGPRGPTSYFYMLPFGVRVMGLKTALTCKLAQDSLYIVDDLALPTSDPEYLRDLITSRKWGYSILFVDDNTELQTNMAECLEAIPEYNAMSAVGLNVYSMIKYDSVVLTLSALERIEERLLFHSTKAGKMNTKFKLPY